MKKLLILVMFTSILTESCSSGTGIKAENSAIDCTSGNLAGLWALAESVYPAGGYIDWSKVEKAAEASGEEIGACFLADMFNLQVDRSPQATVTAEAPQGRQALDKLRAHFNSKKTIHTMAGDY